MTVSYPVLWFLCGACGALYLCPGLGVWAVLPGLAVVVIGGFWMGFAA